MSIHSLSSILQSLTLKGSNITESTFMALIQNCTNLTSLDISGCNSLFLTGQLLSKKEDVAMLKETLKNVTALNLASIRHLSDEMLNRFFAICHNVQKLNLSGNQISFQLNIYQNGHHDRNSISVITFSNIQNIISRNSSILTSLNLSRTAINDSALKALACIPQMHLRELILICCREITSSGITVFVQKQTALLYLDLSQCPQIGDRSLKAVCNGLHKLKVLKLSKCRQIMGDASISSLYRLPSLEVLDLSACYCITSKSLSAGLVETLPLVSLQYLNVSGCTSVHDSFVIKISKVLPNLVHLNLNSCSITDVAVYFVSKYMSRLQELHLGWCREITDNGILGRPLRVDLDDHIHHEGDSSCKCSRRQLGKNILDLPKVKSEQLQQIEDKRLLEQDDDQIHQLTDLKKLLVLDLTACNKITDEAIAELRLPELKQLHLGLCLSISDASLISIAYHLPSLESLYLTQCNKVTDAGLIAIAENLPRLHLLDISNCDHVTDYTMNTLMKYSRQLRHLDVSLCNNISLHIVERLENAMPHMHAVQKRLLHDSV